MRDGFVTMPLQREVSLAVEENRLQTRNIASGKKLFSWNGWQIAFGVEGSDVYIKRPVSGQEIFSSEIDSCSYFS